MTHASEITLIRPDDWHLHVRDGKELKDVIPDTARRFARAIIMPNLNPPVTTTKQALDYRQRILAAVPQGMDFTPLMTLYLTDNTAARELEHAKQSGHVHAVKYYPAGATTHSDAGVTDISNTYTPLAAMADLGIPLLIHGEVTDPDIDVFDRELVFIDTILQPLLKRFPSLNVVLEHITTRQAVEFIQACDDNVAATITAHHLLLNRNAMFKGGMNPHHYCLPILKRETHRAALVEAAISGNKKFFLGSDSAPHAQTAKESACGCAGMYTAHAAIELYAEVFDAHQALDKLEGFASFYGADFYGLPRNNTSITLKKESWPVPATLQFGDDRLVPFRAECDINWKLV